MGTQVTGEYVPDNTLDHERWKAHHGLQEREIAVKEREQNTKEQEALVKISELERSRWTNPLVLAVMAAALAAGGNAGVALINGILQRSLEETRSDAQNELETSKSAAVVEIEEAKAEATRILQVIQTNDPDKAAINLSFLLDAGLISNELRRKSLAAFLASRRPGQGPALPSSQLPGSSSITVAYNCLVDGGAEKTISTLKESLIASKGERYEVTDADRGIWIESSVGGFLISVIQLDAINDVLVKVHGTAQRIKSDEQVLTDPSSTIWEFVPAMVRAKLRELGDPSCAA